MGTALPLLLDRESTTSLAAQLAAAIRELVTTGGLQPDQPVPSTRALAAQLSVSRGTVVAAYDQLISESYLVSRPGSTTRVHPQAGGFAQRTTGGAAARADALEARRMGAKGLTARGNNAYDSAIHGTPAGDGAASRAGDGMSGHGMALPSPRGTQRSSQRAGHPQGVIDLRPHRRIAPRMDDPAWREVWRRAATAPPPAPVTAGHSSISTGPRASHFSPRRAQGLPELRAAIAEHLRLMRSMRVPPENIVVTAGARDGLALLLAALREPLAPVAVESPGYPGLRRVLHRLGVPTIEADTDEEGIVPAHLPKSAHAALVTPNHLFPAGGSMSAPRRMELLRQTSMAGALVIEDDFDSDYRHVGPPLPTLWDLAPDSVLHLGTFTQVLTPEAAVGYVIVPPELVPAIAAAREDLGSGASAIAQRAVAGFLASGGLRRHITRRRRALVRRRERLLGALAGWDVEMVSGAHAVLRLPRAEDARAVAEACVAQGVVVGDLDGYWDAAPFERAPADRTEQSSPDEGPFTAHGIVLNCASASPDALNQALRLLSAALTAHSSEPGGS